jgi:hypothetical protein
MYYLTRPALEHDVKKYNVLNVRAIAFHNNRVKKMIARSVVRRSLSHCVVDRDAAEKAKVIVLDFSPSRITLEEAASLAFHSRNIRSRYNKRRNFLILEFETAREKLAYLKKLPQWLWNRGCVVWEYRRPELDLWRLEALA